MGPLSVSFSWVGDYVLGGGFLETLFPLPSIMDRGGEIYYGQQPQIVNEIKGRPPTLTSDVS